MRAAAVFADHFFSKLSGLRQWPFSVLWSVGCLGSAGWTCWHLLRLQSVIWRLHWDGWASVPLPEVQGFSSPCGLHRWDPQQGNQTSYVEAQGSPKCKGGSCQAFLRLMSEPGQYQSASLYWLTRSSPGQVQGHGNKSQCRWDNDK